MAEKQPEIEFQFVNSTVDAPSVPRDLAVRALIRKQAMKKASAARRRDGNYGKHNLRQYPIFVIDQEIKNEVPTVRELVEEKPLPENKPKPRQQARRATKEKDYAVKEISSLSPSLSAKGYQLISIKSDFDILDLSTLATLHVGRAARRALSEDAHHLVRQLRSHKRWSYLAYLPQLYGHFPCLSDATDCVIARARQLISPHKNWESAVITFYVKALESLQKALDNPAQRYRPEVLCATEILALYELLDPSGEIAWIRHAAGAARLIQLRGPDRYKSDFEKALFMAHTGPIMTECLLNNERCFLEEPEWQTVFRSVITEDDFKISDRSEITVSLIMLKGFVPGFFHDITNITCLGGDPDLEYINAVAAGLRHLTSQLSRWHERYVVITECYPDMLPGSPEYDGHCKVFSTYLSCLMISSRLLSVLSTHDRAGLEDTSQELADQMLELNAKIQSSSRQTSLFMAQTLGVAKSIKITQKSWQQYCRSSEEVYTEIGLPLARTQVRRWCEVIGRKMPPIDVKSSPSSLDGK
ncbi:hypothetical protein BGZ60DRAFT_29241 [Tricladium varicosporioides]|nr:hypothetical protein BGZ60DRAFT_29241 [Hymenoscyphus varicosporioides]